MCLEGTTMTRLRFALSHAALGKTDFQPPGAHVDIA